MTPTLLLIALGVGLLLLVAEVFLPTSGLLFVPAVVLLGLSLVGAFSNSPEMGFGFLAAEAVLVPATLGGSATAFNRTLRRASMELDPDVDREGPDLDRLVGSPGRALSPLRPSGKVEFEGRRLEGLAEEGLIAAGTPVLAVRVRSGCLVVREVPGSPPVEARAGA